MTAIIVIGVILLILFALAITKISLYIAYDEKFKASVSVFGITLYSTERQGKPDTKVKEQTANKNKKKDSIIKTIYEQKGLKYTIELASDLLRTVFGRLLWLVRRIKIRNFMLSLSVVGDDAADTAVKYGAICSVIYPLLAFLDTVLDFKAKRIDVNADFEGKDIEFKISASIKAEIFVLAVLAVRCIKEYLRIKNRLQGDLNRQNNVLKDVL